MEKMWMRALVTVALCLAVGACAKKKDSNSEVNVADTRAPVPAPAEPSPAKTEVPDAGSKKDTKEVPRDLKVHEKTKSSPIQSPSSSSPSSADNEGRGRRGDGGSAAKPSEKADELDTLMAEADRYSGSAEDSLREFLSYKQMKNSDRKTQIRKAQFAQSIEQAVLQQKMEMGLIKVNLSVRGSNGALTEVGFVAKRTDGRKQSLASNTKSYSASITCMDETLNPNQVCGTSVVEVQSQGVMAQIIFRHTALVLNGIFPDHSCQTSECEDLYDFFRYTERKIVDKNTLRSAVMDSSEVVLGRSAFKVIVLTNDDQIMKLAGPLANPAKFPSLDTPVDRSLTDEDLMDASTGRVLKTRMNEILNDVRIVSNDGRGHVTLLVKMKMREDGSRDTFQIRLDRTVKPIQALVEQVPVAAANNSGK